MQKGWWALSGPHQSLVCLFSNKSEQGHLGEDKNIKQQKTRTGELKRVLPSFLFCCTVDVIFLPHFSKASVADRVSDPDPHKDMPPGSGCAWIDADPDLDKGDKKSLENIQIH